jgi:ribosomal protein L11 methyltransferase
MTYQPHPLPADTVTATFNADEQSARRVADSVADAFFAKEVAVSLVDVGHSQWRVTFYFQPGIDERAVRDLAIAAAGTKAAAGLHFARIAAKDWVAESLLGLKPITVGRFVVHGGHDRGSAPPNRIGIEIEAAQAFGTGHHGSTRGCLVALDAICRLVNGTRRRRVSPLRRRNLFPRVLDLGTGSGVLAIAAAKSLHRRVLASDIDAAVVRIARGNARLNRSGLSVRLCLANGLAAADIRAGAPFDLVFANILLAPLQKLAAPLTRMVAPRGRLILSGLLNSQANAARAAYPHFALERHIAIDGWITLVLKRSATLPFQPKQK